jgi:hypothetical protein
LQEGYSEERDNRAVLKDLFAVYKSKLHEDKKIEVEE